MFNKSKIITSLVISLISLSQISYGKVAMSELVLPKAPAYRVGVSEIPENQYIEAQEDVNKSQGNIAAEDENFNNDVSYADLSIKRLSREISRDLEYEERDMVADLSLLWQGAAMQSDTINFALYKLANPDSDKPDKGSVKKVLQTLASMSTLVGAGMANPLLAGTSFISGNVLGIMSQDTKALNYKYTKVTDADMIILIRKVEDLQQNAVNLYYDYMCAKKQYEMTTNLLKERKERFETAQQNSVSRELIVITDAYYRTALDKQKTARSEFLSKRAALEQFVGNEAFTQFENELYERESSTPKDENPQNTQTLLNSTDGSSYSGENSDENKLTTSTSSFQSTGGEEILSSPYSDENLKKLPDITPLEGVNNPATAEGISQNILRDNTQVSDNIPEKKVKTKKTREEKLQEKYSTKGLIFLHDGQPKAQEYTQPEKNTASSKKKKTQKNKNISEPQQDLGQLKEPAKTTPASSPAGLELLPLDEIRVPDLHKNGYSIFEGY